MKKYYIVFLLILFFLPVSAFSQEYSASVGIVDFLTENEETNKAEAVTSELSVVLGKFRFIKLVERSQMEPIMQEIELGQSGLIDEATAVQAGKLCGAGILIYGSISGSSISARAVSTGTGKAIAVSTVREGEVQTLGRELASGIETHIARENLKRLRNDTLEIKLDFAVEKRTGNKGTEIASAVHPGRIRIGESISFRFKSDTDGFLTIIDIQPGGDVVILYPNDYSPSNAVKSGAEYSIPSKDDSFEMTASEPAGIDNVVAFFTKRKVEWLDKSKLTGEGFKTVKEGEKLALARGISVASTQLKRNEWKSLAVTIEITE